MFINMCVKNDVKAYARSSFGFYHHNIILIEGDGSTSIRINPGINPEDSDIIIKFFEEISCLA
jgi:hypothetical protein